MRIRTIAIKTPSRSSLPKRTAQTKSTDSKSLGFEDLNPTKKRKREDRQSNDKSKASKQPAKRKRLEPNLPVKKGKLSELIKIIKQFDGRLIKEGTPINQRKLQSVLGSFFKKAKLKLVDKLDLILDILNRLDQLIDAELIVTNEAFLPLLKSISKQPLNEIQAKRLNRLVVYCSLADEFEFSAAKEEEETLSSKSSESETSDCESRSSDSSSAKDSDSNSENASDEEEEETSDCDREQNTRTIYYLNRPKDTQKLTTYMKMQGRKFIRDEVDIPIQVEPVAIMGPMALGVYASEDILLRQYRFSRYKYEGSPVYNPKVNGAYLFEIENGLFIDGQKKLSWTALVNHSFNPNIVAQVDTHKKEILFAIKRDIKKGEPLLIDYGKDFFPNLEEPVIPFYLGRYDKYSLKELVNVFQSDYCGPIFSCPHRPLKLGSTQLKMTLLFKAVLEGNHAQIKRYCAESEHPDLPSLAIMGDRKGYSFKAQHEQIYITPLMLACYLGDKIAVKLLLDHKNCDINARTLAFGNTAAMYLVSGNALSEQKIEILKLLLQKGALPLLTNRENKNLLQLSIEQDCPSITEYLLTTKIKQFAKNLLLLAKNQYQYEELVKNNRMDMLKVLFTFIKSNGNETFLKALTKENHPLYHAFKEASISSIQQTIRLLIKILNVNTQAIIVNSILKSLERRVRLERGVAKNELCEIAQDLLSKTKNSRHLGNWDNKFSTTKARPSQQGYFSQAKKKEQRIEKLTIGKGMNSH